MRKRILTIGILLIGVIIIGGASICSGSASADGGIKDRLASETKSFESSAEKTVIRYRMTVEVEVYGKITGGSGVHQTTYIRYNSDSYSYVPFFAGEAITVDLKDKGVLFITLRSESWQGEGSWCKIFELPWRVFREKKLLPEEKWTRCEPWAFYGRKEEVRKDQKEYWQALQQFKNVKVEVMPSELVGTSCPYMVSFRDLENPKSVFSVDAHNLAKTFGPGVHLKRIIFETTNDPVTVTIEKKLPWLKGFRGTLGGERDMNLTIAPSAQYLTREAFITYWDE